ncbi:MAG: flippase-like domain-containing protein [Thermomicrobiales bacterium]|nr:flippase-like domain-containing protein [Thermomicrobiales bacterium]
MTNPIRRLWNDYSTASPESKRRVQRALTLGWLVIVAVLAVWVLRNQQDQLRDIVDRLKTANRNWLVAVIVIEILSIWSVAYTYKLTLDRLGHKASTAYQFDLHLQRTGVNFAAPFGGAATAYVYVERMKRVGINRQDALLALIMRTLSVYGATVVVIVLTAALSGRPLFVIGAVIGLVAMILGLIALARQGQGDWKTILRWARRLPQKMQRQLVNAIDQFKEHRLTPADFLGTVATTLLTRICTLAMIYACVRAVGFTPDLYGIFLAYVASFVAARIIPVLYGMGAVEGSLTLSLQRSGVPADIAIGATLLFRFFDFFLPSLIGLAMYAWAERKNPSFRRLSVERVPTTSQREEAEDL